MNNVKIHEFKNKNIVLVYGDYPNQLNLEIEHVSNMNETKVHIGGIKDVYIVNDVPNHLRDVFVACIIVDGKITYMEEMYYEMVFKKLKISKQEKSNLLSEEVKSLYRYAS